MGYKEEIAWRWERHKEFLDSKKPTYTAVKAAQENHQYDEFPVISLKVMREQGIQFLCSWGEDRPDTCDEPAIRLNQGDALCNRHFLAKIGTITRIKTSSIDNIKQAKEFKKRLDNLHGPKETERALNMARYTLLRRAVYNLSRGEEVPSLDEVVSREVEIHNIGTGKRMALKEALEWELCTRNDVGAIT